ncbi:hypothetical protein [Streptomyces sp. NBC_01320]|uniref:hypothetical protein n=1 Tax=Streptomyces sp. NBC_01320 TaxID=2903824 RepID=UPI002E10D6A7|nr:hypothetical protein OG395_42885 [Streptomyces sp. NBC_01320]
MTEGIPEPDVVDHAGRLLYVLTYCSGMGMSLSCYPHASVVLKAHSAALFRLEPSVPRFLTAAMLARNLADSSEATSVGAAEQWAGVRSAYLALLNDDAWTEAGRSALADGDERTTWLASTAAEPGLRALAPQPGP